MLIKTSKKTFDEKLNGFLVGIEIPIQEFSKESSILASRDITYAKYLASMESIDREITTYIEEVTFDRENFAKNQIRHFFTEHKRVAEMLLAEKGLIFKSIKYTNREISDEIVRHNKRKYKIVLAIRDYARACDSIIFAGISSVYNIPEIENLSINETVDLLLNRLYRIRDNETYFPLREILKGNGVGFNRIEFYDYIVRHLQNENFIDIKKEGDDFYVRISLNGIHKMEQQKQKFLNVETLKSALWEIKNKIPTTGIKKSIEKLKTIFIDPESDNFNSIVLIEFQYFQILDGEIKGILSPDSIRIGKNRIVNSLLELIEIIAKSSE